MRGSVGVNYFDTFIAPIVAGRGFNEGDLAAGSNVAIVDQTFVHHDSQRPGRGGPPCPRDAARKASTPGPWLEIVGVVTDLTDDTNKQPGESLLFRPAAAETPRRSTWRCARADNPAADVAAALIAGEIDPSAAAQDMMTLDAVGEADLVALDFFARLLAGVSIVAIILATAGVYALMSFTVARRTSEIGIRVALGADPRRIITSTFARAFTQVLIGLVLGGIPAAAIVAAVGPDVAATNGSEVAIGSCLVSLAIVTIVTAIACFFPARRALRIQPTDALKTT